MNQKPLVIEKDKLLLVEGNDEEHFFSTLLSILNPDSRPVQIIPYNGKAKLKAFLEVLRIETSFSQVKKLAICIDADQNAAGTFNSVQSSLRACELIAPAKWEYFEPGTPDVGVFVMPGSGATGALETLCLEALKNEPEMKCVQTFLTCIESDIGKKIASPEKFKIKSFIATLSKSRLIGEAAREGKLNFSDPNYDGIKSFLNSLIM